MRTLVTRSAAVVMLGLLVLVAGTRADEEKIALDKLPAVVVDAVKAKFPGAELIGAEKENENGKLFYEVAIKHKGSSIEVTLTPEGKIVSVEKEIAAKDLPKAVTDALDAKYPKATFKKVEEVTKDEKLTYEVLLVTTDDRRLEVTLDPNGKILEEENKGKQKSKDKGEKG